MIGDSSNEVKFCFEQELQKDPTLTGKVAVAFVINRLGGVGNVAVTENTVNATMGECMVSRIKRWQFPRPLGGGKVSVTYPWIFKLND